MKVSTSRSKEHEGETSDEEQATDRWENEGGHTVLAQYERNDQQDDLYILTLSNSTRLSDTTAVAAAFPESEMN